MPHARDFVLLARLDARLTEGSRGIETRHEQSGTESVWHRTMKPLGRGGMGEVYREQCIAGERVGALRAVKAIQKPNSRIDYSRELEAIARFSQPQYQRCFVESFGWYETVDTVFIAMEYVEHGDLQQSVGSPMPENEMQRIASQVLEALAFLHSSGYAHRDLKPANLLVCSKGPQWHVKIADFGLTKRVIESLTSLRTQGGTWGYMAPELLALGNDEDSDDESAHSYTNAVDIWALGVISYVMLTGDLPFPASDLRPLRRYVQGKVTFPSSALTALGVSAQGCAWIEDCMAPSPWNRPSAGFSRRHLWPMGLGSLESAQRSSNDSSFPDKGGEHTVAPLPPTIEPGSPVLDTEASKAWSTHGTADQTTVIAPVTIKPETAAGNKQLPFLGRDLAPRVAATRSPESAGMEPQWTYLKRLVGHRGEVHTVAFSPDGRLVATGSEDGTAVLWYVASGQEAKRLVAPTSQSKEERLNAVLAVAFSPDGRLLATGAANGIARLWNAATGMIVKRLQTKVGDPVFSVAFSPDGRVLGTGQWLERATLFDTTSGAKLRQLESRSNYTRAISFSPDGRLIAVAGWSDRDCSDITFFDTASGVVAKQLKGLDCRVWDVKFSPDGRLLVTGGSDGRAVLWNVISMTKMMHLGGHNAPVLGVTFSPDGRLLATATGKGDAATARVWTVSSGTLVQRLDGQDGPVFDVAFSPDGRRLATASSDGAVRLYLKKLSE